MRRVVPLAVGLCIGLLSAAVAHAQDAPANERVLLDMKLWLVTQQADGYCADIDAGELTVRLQAVGQDPNGAGQPWPVEFKFYGLRGFDDAASIDVTLSTLAPTTTVVPLQGGGLYCFDLRNLAEVPDNATTTAELAQYWQGVNVRMSVHP